MLRPARQCFQDQHVQCPLDQIALFAFISHKLFMGRVSHSPGYQSKAVQESRWFELNLLAMKSIGPTWAAFQAGILGFYAGLFTARGIRNLRPGSEKYELDFILSARARIGHHGCGLCS